MLCHLYSWRDYNDDLVTHCTCNKDSGQSVVGTGKNSQNRGANGSSAKRCGTFLHNRISAAGNCVIALSVALHQRCSRLSSDPVLHVFPAANLNSRNNVKSTARDKGQITGETFTLSCVKNWGRSWVTQIMSEHLGHQPVGAATRLSDVTAGGYAQVGRYPTCPAPHGSAPAPFRLLTHAENRPRRFTLLLTASAKRAGH